LGVTRFRKRDLAYLVSGGHKVIWDFSRGDGWLFDLGPDAAERSPEPPLATSEGRQMVQELRRRVAAGQALAYARDDDAETEIDEELRERLRSLGYVD
jgi:hypothetical protein